MKLELIINNEKKEYTVGYLSMMVVRKALEIQERVDLNNIKASELDTIVEFICEAYGYQFSREEIYRGIPAKGFILKIIKTINDIVSELTKVADEMGETPEVMIEHL